MAFHSFPTSVGKKSGCDVAIKKRSNTNSREDQPGYLMHCMYGIHDPKRSGEIFVKSPPGFVDKTHKKVSCIFIYFPHVREKFGNPFAVRPQGGLG